MNVIENFLWMRPNIFHHVCLVYAALGIYQITAPEGDAGPLVIVRTPRLIRLGRFFGHIGQDWELEPMVLGETLVVFRGVVRDTDHLDPGLVELRGSITEPHTFDSSAGGACLHEPPQHHPLAAEVL